MPVGVIKDNIAGRSTTSGADDFFVTTPDGQHDSFENLVDGETYAYKAVYVDASDGYETGTGVWTAAGTTLSRTPKTSSNGGGKVDWSGAELLIYIVADKEMLDSLDSRIIIQEGAAPVTPQPALNFSSTDFDLTNNAGNSSTDVTVSRYLIAAKASASANEPFSEVLVTDAANGGELRRMSLATILYNNLAGDISIGVGSPGQEGSLLAIYAYLSVNSPLMTAGVPVSGATFDAQLAGFGVFGLAGGCSFKGNMPKLELSGLGSVNTTLGTAGLTVMNLENRETEFHDIKLAGTISSGPGSRIIFGADVDASDLVLYADGAEIICEADTNIGEVYINQRGMLDMGGNELTTTLLSASERGVVDVGDLVLNGKSTSEALFSSSGGMIRISGDITITGGNAGYEPFIVETGGIITAGAAVNNTSSYATSTVVLGRINQDGSAFFYAAIPTSVTTPYLMNIVEDVTPELGGDLDATGKEINNVDRLDIVGKGSDYTALSSAFIRMGTDTVHDWFFATMPAGYEFVGTHSFPQGSNLFGSGNLFQANPVITAASNVSGFLGSFYPFLSGVTYTADTNTVTSFGFSDFMSQPVFNIVNSGVHTGTGMFHFHANNCTVGSGVTLESRVGVTVRNATKTGSGVITGQAGFMSAALTSGTNNTAVLTGTTTIPNGNFNLYQAGTNPNRWNGGQRFKIRVVSGSTATMTTADYVLVMSSTASPATVTLPSAIGRTGLTLTIKKTGASGSVDIKSVSNQTADGVNITTGSINLATQYDLCTLVSDGSNWHILKVGAP